MRRLAQFPLILQNIVCPIPPSSSPRFRSPYGSISHWPVVNSGDSTPSTTMTRHTPHRRRGHRHRDHSRSQRGRNDRPNNLLTPQQNYPGKFSILVVDDHSQDATAKLATKNPRIKIRTSSNTKLDGSFRAAAATWLDRQAFRPGCWSRSCHARSRGFRRSTPTYFWFTDADIVHAPDTLSRLVARAEQNNLALTSFMVLLRAQTFPERFLIPPFLFFFLKLYPPTKIANPNSRVSRSRWRLHSPPPRRARSHRRPRRDPRRSHRRLRPSPRRQTPALRWKKRKNLDGRHPQKPQPPRLLHLRRSPRHDRPHRLHPTPLLRVTPHRYPPRPCHHLPRPHRAPLRTRHRHTPRCARHLARHVALFLPTVRYYRISTHWAATLPLAATFYAGATFLSARVTGSIAAPNGKAARKPHRRRVNRR